jgi:CelD/BcsL family acetyltransferase involved in cellulose biosynthesis/protein-tyrosine-phosphatase/predicted ATP-grasp superfamily ATP-dependent carboligase
MLEIRICHSLEEVPPEAWEALVAQCPDSTIFQTRAWLGPWWAAFRSDSMRPWIFCAYEGDRLVGLAPLVLNAEEHTLQWLGEGHSDYQTFPARNAEPHVVEALLEAIAARVPRRVVIDLSQVPQFSTLGVILARRSQERSSGIVIEGKTACPWLDLDAREVTRVTAKESVKRGERKLLSLGQLRFSRLSEAAHIEPMLETFFAQHIVRWSGTAYPSLFNREQNRTFYRDLVHVLAPSRSLQFSVLSLNDRPIAQHFGMLSKDRLLWYKPTFETSLAKCSPGEALLKNLIVDARNQGLRVLDFTRGDEPFKLRFASSVAYNISFSWIRRAWQALPRRWYASTRHSLHSYRESQVAQRPAARKSRKALVLDAHSPAGIEVVQSLGREGIEVHAASGAEQCDAFHSRYVAKILVQPPAIERAQFAAWLQERDAESGPYELIIPATENSLLPIKALPAENSIRGRAMLAPEKAIEMALSKEETWKLAKQVGVPVPASRLISSWDDVDSAIEYPVVLKPTHSLVRSEHAQHQLTAIVVRNAAERETHLRRILPLSPVQEQVYFGGSGLGVECLYHRGQMVAAFVHERVHELPLTGGGSSYRRSRPLHAQGVWAARRLLDTLNWHGVAMVEFKLDRRDAICLMEINPRFWGSLALAIDAGVDFPAQLWRLASGGVPTAQPRYQTNYFTRHFAKDVDWMKENWRASHSDPLLLTRPRLRSIVEYARPLWLKESHDHFSWNDPAIYLLQLRRALRANAGVAWQRLIRKPFFDRRMRRHAERVLAAANQGGRKVDRVLFLCYGNICRSPFADCYARARAQRLDISSAGFHTTGNRVSPQHVVSAANSLGVAMTEHRSRVVTPETLAAADLIVVMDEDNWRRTGQMQANALERTIMLGALGDLDSVVIDDPYTMNEVEAKRVLVDIIESVDRLIDRVARSSA